MFNLLVCINDPKGFHEVANSLLPCLHRVATEVDGSFRSIQISPMQHAPEGHFFTVTCAGLGNQSSQIAKKALAEALDELVANSSLIAHYKLRMIDLTASTRDGADRLLVGAACATVDELAINTDDF